MGPETNPISPDPKIRAAAVAHLDRVLECGQAFGCEILCGPTHSAIGVFSGEGPTEKEFKYGVETLRRAAEKAQARGIKIAIEYLNRFEIYFLTTAVQTSRFVQAVDHPYCKMMYDSFHAHIEEKSQSQAIAACAAETIHVHVSENDRGVPGTGQVDWDGFFGGLKQSGYDGYSDDRGVWPGVAGPGGCHQGVARPVPRRAGACAATGWRISSRIFESNRGRTFRGRHVSFFKIEAAR